MHVCHRINKPLIRFSILGLFCSLCSYSASLAHTPLDPSKVMEFKISKTGLTRISIDNDSIEDVYAYPAEPDLITHHKSGHVFVTPDELEIPVYLTVITRRGAAQDLRLIPISKKAEPILLKYEEPKKNPLPASSSPPRCLCAPPRSIYGGQNPSRILFCICP